MFWLPLIETAICLVFLYLLMSILVSSIYEFISERRNLRGKLLYRFLLQAFHDPTGRLPNIGYQILKHPLLRTQTLKQNRKLEKISEDLFARVYLEVARTNIDQIKNYPSSETDSKPSDAHTQASFYVPDGVFKSISLAGCEDRLTSSSDDSSDEEEAKVKTWYNELTSYVSYQYKRNTRGYLFVISLLLAIIFNIDTIFLVERFWNDATLRESINSLAEGYLENAADYNDSLLLKELPYSNTSRYNDLGNQDLYDYLRHFPIGWSNTVNTLELNVGLQFKIYGLMLLGWLLTAFSLTFGAPFWYDVLRHLFQIKSIKLQS